MRMLFVAAAALVLVGCSDSLEDQTARLEKFAKANKYGTSNDYWLVKNSPIAGPNKVALVFGLMDDREFCEDLARLYMNKYRGDRYTCLSAN